MPEIECPECFGDRTVETITGYVQYGSGYGDCEQTYEDRPCPECHGTGKVEQTLLTDEAA